MLTDKSTIEVIEKSRKQVSILFSDIEHSTRHWERRGDVDARILLDRHNRLLFPVIRKFRGKIIKTLGDSIMAAFESTDNALKAGIAIQQMLARERQKDKYFSLRTRIGIHTGKCLVEMEDIFGDVVNVAAKVESAAQANEILITRATEARLKDSYSLNEHPGLKLTGKLKQVELFRCDWENHPSLIEHIRSDAILPLLKRHKFEILSYVVISLLALFFIYHHYLRYLLADAGLGVEQLFSSSQLPSDYPLLIIIQTLTMVGFALYLLRIDFISRILLRLLNGLFAASLLILLFAAINHYFELPFSKRWSQPVYESNHLFVRILVDQTQINEQPSKRSKTLQVLPAGEIFIYLRSKTIDGLRWDEVVYRSATGWIPRRILPAFGVAEQQLTVTHKFYFRYYDVYALVLASIAFVWGYMGYKIRPS